MATIKSCWRRRWSLNTVLLLLLLLFRNLLLLNRSLSMAAIAWTWIARKAMSQNGCPKTASTQTRIFQYLSGNAVREIVSDTFSTYMDTRHIANFRDTKGIILGATPPYMHWMNHIAEDMIHRSTISTRVRLPGLRGKIVKERPINDPSVYHPFATERSNQCRNLVAFLVVVHHQHQVLLEPYLMMKTARSLSISDLPE